MGLSPPLGHLQMLHLTLAFTEELCATKSRGFALHIYKRIVHDDESASLFLL